MKKLLRRFSTIFSPVTINYHELITGQNLFRKIEDGYSEDGLGLIAIVQIPWYQEKRMAALSYGRLLYNLPASEKSKILRPEINYFYGWREGKEPILGKKNDFKNCYQGLLEHD
ncbi:unnamed protein product [Blepharisma stoltei]|uniref:Uncharacterized protein n=1 Tax=Blepharisma stoltei TaxID=1481888 RepID=A0AAU9JE89_9CILI|nr:unnamed protein product [Blepharisma stoltei]